MCEFYIRKESGKDRTNPTWRSMRAGLAVEE